MPPLADSPFNDPAALAVHPGFRDCLVQTATGLLSIHDALPREVRYLSDLRRWLLSQAALALDLEHRRNPDMPQLSPGTLTTLMAQSGIASRNTVSAFLAELKHYALLEHAASPDRRLRGLRATARARLLLEHWFALHLAGMDRLDGGTRLERLQSSPALFEIAQPAMLRHLLTSGGWTHPPAGIANFTRADSGSNLLHHLAARAPAMPGQDPVDIGPVTAAEVAQRYLISPSHAARLLARAEDSGAVRWERPGHRGACLLCLQLVRDYRLWQAAKFIAIEHGWRAAEAAAGTGAHSMV